MQEIFMTPGFCSVLWINKSRHPPRPHLSSQVYYRWILELVPGVQGEAPTPGTSKLGGERAPEVLCGNGPSAGRARLDDFLGPSHLYSGDYRTQF